MCVPENFKGARDFSHDEAQKPYKGGISRIGIALAELDPRHGI